MGSWCRSLLIFLVASTTLAYPSNGQYVAQLTSEKLLDDGQTYAASYSSALFGGDVTVQVSPRSVILSTFAPNTLVAGLSKDATNVPMNETFELPPNATDLTIVNHINVFYDPFGAYPYPEGKKNPLWSSNISRSMDCVTCWFYITFFFIGQTEAQQVSPQCANSPSLFCSSMDMVSWAVTPEPDKDFLPKTFTRASGDFYDRAVVRSSVAGDTLTGLKKLGSPVTPLIASQLGQFWVDAKHPPYTFTYNDTVVLSAQNYYLSTQGEIIAIGQVVSRDYFDFFSNFFGHLDRMSNHVVNATGPFSVPSNFSIAGNYPGAALTTINGFKGVSTYNFGFSNTTFRMPPPSNPANSLVLNLPWLVASVWIAGAVVLLSDHL